MKNLAPRVEQALDEAVERTKSTLHLVFEFMGSMLGKVDGERVERFIKPFLDSMPHVVRHEIAHAYVDKLLEDIDLPLEKKIALAEILARFIERKTSLWLREQGYNWVLVESFDSQLAELKAYPELEGVDISSEKYRQLYEEFEESVKQGKLRKYVQKLIRDLRLSP